MTTPPSLVRLLTAAFIALFVSGVASLTAQELPPPAKTAAPEQTTEQKVDQLLQLLGQDDVRALLTQKLAASGTEQPPQLTPQSQLSDLDQWASKRREHLGRLARDLPGMSTQITSALGRLCDEIRNYGASIFLLHVLILFGVGLAGGIATNRIIVMQASRRNGADIGKEASAVVSRMLLPVLGYGLAATAIFLAIQWPPLLSAVLLPWLATSVVLPLLFAFTGLLRRVVGREANARRDFWIVRWTWLLTLAGLFWALLRTLENLDVPRDTLGLLSSAMVGLLFLLACIWIWRRPVGDPGSERARAIDVALIFSLIILFGLRLAGAGVLFWIGLYALVLPGLASTLGIAARKLATDIGSYGESDLRPVLVERGVRLAIVGTAIIWLIFLVRAHPDSLPDGALLTSIVVGVLHGALILLLADLIWIAIKSMIARRLELSAPAVDPLSGQPGGQPQDDRLLTILPILRNMLGIIIAAVAVMTALSELGVNIGPLLASAGIFGIAIGFGSQTLVKDIISGVFYMIDDAFRVGEYIQSGSYRGTVESFSIRSVKLRHHRGPIFTVPFGSLGAVENMSRDWSIDKFLVTVAFDTDIAKVRAITKEIGKALKEDPEFGPFLIETVKLKGVEQFGEYGMTLGFGMMLRAGGQSSMVRRKAYSMLKDAFAQNDIQFASMAGAYPTASRSARPKEPEPGGETGPVEE
ncbi:mechanosensitive ion channel domain-containing protein [Agrobacterium arsenijevicii]|uniref:Mechanosensitive ion channel protein n=1 Tax=Agrobacterium arsenijevicii TaxID=1585697 RepID=A0ABR5D6I1_9HYPH|nr:mechanosensitive ion channel protein [Agrobacterium arsenijevicii]